MLYDTSALRGPKRDRAAVLRARAKAAAGIKLPGTMVEAGPLRQARLFKVIEGVRTPAKYVKNLAPGVLGGDYVSILTQKVVDTTKPPAPTPTSSQTTSGINSFLSSLSSIIPTVLIIGAIAFGASVVLKPGRKGRAASSSRTGRKTSGSARAVGTGRKTK